MTITAVLLELSEQAGRAYNQDRIAVLRDAESGDFLALVSDGVGGTAKGEVAAECLITTAQAIWQQRTEFDSVKALLEALFNQANHAIAAANQAGTNTAATVVALAARGSEVMSLHAGDSRIYQCRAGKVVQVTHDHSLAYAKFKLGEISEAEIATHPGQSQLLNCMTGQADVHAEYTHWQVQNGDQFVLCSDGFWELFPQAEMADLAANENRHFVIENRLEQMLAEHPKHDNTSVVMLGCIDGFAPTAVPVEPPVGASRPAGSKRWASLIIALAAIAVTTILVYPQYLGESSTPAPTEQLPQPLPDPLPQPLPEPEQAEQPEQIEQPQQSETPQQPSESSDSPDQIDENDQPPPTEAPSSEQERGDSNNPTEQLNRRLNEAPRDTIPTDGSRPDIDVLKEHLEKSGVINKESDLEQTDEIKDELAHIVTVQLMVHDTPVYGAMVRYLKTSAGLQLISGRLAYLEAMPKQPQVSFDSCYARYQEQQQTAGETVKLLPDTEPVRYIDAGDSTYFWAIQVEQSVQPSLAELHLRDGQCDIIRVLPLQVSG